MLCQRCKQSPGTINLLIDGSDRMFCTTCARKELRYGRQRYWRRRASEQAVDQLVAGLLTVLAFAAADDQTRRCILAEMANPLTGEREGIQFPSDTPDTRN